MKKLFTILSLILVCNIANAQRLIDLSATIVKPAVSAIIHSGDTISVQAVFTNVGSVAIKTIDTLYFQWGILDTSRTNVYYAYPNASQFLKLGRQKALAKNDTIQLNLKFLPLGYSYATDSLRKMCIVVGAYNLTADSVRDVNTANNLACNLVTLKMHTAAIPSVNNNTNVTKVFLFPSPAQNVANFDLDVVSTNQVTINIYDMVGRLVTTKNVGTLSAGQHSIPVNTTELLNGVYIYNVISGGEISSGKFSIAK